MPSDDAGGGSTGGGSATGGGGGLSSATGGGGGGGGGVLPQDAGTDAGSDAGLDTGTSPADAGLVPVFVLIGKQGRRAISCDDGRTWRNDVAFDDAWPMEERYRCWQGDYTLSDGGTQHTDCDHNAYSSTSLTVVAPGVFLSTMGWGAPGTFWRSTDGIAWQQVLMGANVTDVLVGDSGRLIAATRGSRVSDDRGLTWRNGVEIDVASGGNTIWNIRGGVAGGGVYLVTAQDGSNLDFEYSADEGQTWHRPTFTDGGRLDVCGAGHPAYGNGIFVTMSWSSSLNATVICRSADGARTWTQTSLPDGIESRPIWTGTEFMAWSPGRVHRSTDGLTWTSANTQTRRNGTLSQGPNPGPVAVNANGTFAAVKGGWNVWYEQQRFYRSTDGVIWDELPDGAYRQGHPVTMMVAGWAERSSVCP